MPIDVLELAALTDTGAGPLYRQVKLELQRAIESGRCRLGQALPNETTIARALKVREKPVEYRVSTVNTALHDYVSVRS